MSGHCDTCALAHRIGYSNCIPGDPAAGVDCGSFKVAYEMAQVDTDTPILEHFYTHGSIEVVHAKIVLDEDTPCEHWEPKGTPMPSADRIVGMLISLDKYYFIDGKVVSEIVNDTLNFLPE